MNNSNLELTPEQLSDQYVAEDNLRYSKLFNSEEVIEQYVDEFGQRFVRDEEGNWILNED